MLKFVPDYLKTKKMCKHPAKKLTFVIRCIFVRYKIQQICDKAVDNYANELEFVHDCYKTHKYVTKLSILIHLQYYLFLNTIRLKKFLIKLSIPVFFFISFCTQ